MASFATGAAGYFARRREARMSFQTELDRDLARAIATAPPTPATAAAHRARATPVEVAWQQPSRRYFVGRPCPYCGEAMTKRGARMATKDHVHPRSKGGLLHGPNRIVCCWTCNNDKNDLTIEAWHYRLARGGDARAERVGVLAVQLQAPSP